MPNRIIKESICRSDTIAQLSWFEEVCWYRLIVNCDDAGRMDARIAILKAELFPLADVTHSALTSAIKKLVSLGLVIPYEYSGKPYLYLPTWSEHQRIRDTKPKYPEPPADISPQPAATCDEPPQDAARARAESESKSESYTPPYSSPKGEAPRRRKPSTLSREQEALFNRFWSAYPRKESLGDAEKAWAKLNADESLTQEIIKAIDTAKRLDSRFRERQFTPHPASWLNGREWKNQYDEPEQPGYRMLRQ